MTLEDYGWDSWFDEQYKSLNLKLKTGRIMENREVYRVICADGIINAGISHRLFYATTSDSELPVTGDWVLIIEDDSDTGYSIYDILPRRSLIEVSGEESSGVQVPAAANIDYILAAVPAGTGIDPPVMEKMADLTGQWGAEPVFVCYGTESGNNETEDLKRAAGDSLIIFTDSIDENGLAGLNSILARGKTYAVAGIIDDDLKAIISTLAGGEIPGADGQGRGALKLLPSSAVLYMMPLACDNAYSGVDYEGEDFGDILEIAVSCRFNDCRHENEPGCAVLEAVDSGEIDYDYFRAFLKVMKKGKVEKSTGE